MSSSRFLKSSSKITSRKLPSLYQRDLPLIVSRDGLVQHIHRESKINPHCSALISLDVSNTVIGVAITDATRTFVEPLTRFKLHSVNKLPHPPIFIVNKLEELFKSNGICAVILGWPLELNGNAGTRCHSILTYIRNLHAAKKFELPFLLWDERFSTVDAMDSLRWHGHSEKKISRLHDQWAAAEILKSFLLWAGDHGISSLSK